MIVDECNPEPRATRRNAKGEAQASHTTLVLEVVLSVGGQVK